MRPISATRRFFGELRRRKVLRVGIAYLLVGWLLLQVAELTFEPLRLPEWALTFVIWIVALGFPAALVFAWALEMTPSGLRPERAAERAEEKNPQAAASGRDEASIAVLPFVDMSAERDQGYFCEGMAEEILNALMRIDGLQVAARTSAFQYKGQWMDVRTIGRNLGVGTVLEGSVRQSGSRLRVTAQLIDVDTGYHLWSERYDRPLQDVFAIQDEIARNIAEALKPHLTAGEREAIHTPATSCKAYDYYLRGLQYFHGFGAKKLGYARQMFEQALQIDPGYARAWAGLADTLAFIYMYVEATEEHCRLACQAGRRAVELDVSSAEAHASKGLTELLSKRYESAEAAFEEALRLNPKLYEAWYFYARACAEQGKDQRAAELYEAAAQLRPEDYQAPALAVQVYLGLGQRERARDAARRAVAAAERVLELNPDEVRALYLGANALALLGEHQRGREWAEAALAIEPEEGAVLYNLACFYTQVGEGERALDLLEQARLPATANRSWMEHDSSLDPLRGHPRFEALLAQLRP